MNVGTNRRTDQVNRRILTFLALLLIIAGGLGMAYSLGAFGKDRAMDPVISEDVRSFVDDQQDWFWPVVAAVAVLLALLCLRWLVFQLKPRPSLGDFTFASDEDRGQTVVPSGAVERAVVTDLESEPGVRKAGARLRQHSDPLTVDAWVDYDSASQVPALREKVQGRVVPDLQGALEVDDAVITLEVRPVSGRVGDRVK
jgi:hypothetical protein